MMNRCQGYTKTGQRCKKRTRDESNRCHIHLNQQPSQQTLSQISFMDDDVVITQVIPARITQSRTTQSRTIPSTRVQTRSVTRNIIENAIENYRNSLLLDDDVQENLDRHRLMELLELERERITQDMRVREPPRRPRKPVRKNKEQKNKDEEEDIETYKGQTEDCCICMDCKVKDIDFLECKHAVCRDCVKNLRDPRCPMCRADIKARFITDKDRKAMKAKERQDKAERANEAFRNYLAQERFSNLIFGNV